MSRFFIGMVRFYQKYISVNFPASCRYYPTCSEYAIWSFENSNFLRAFFSSFLRILRCNKFFKGGIDYPTTVKKFNKPYIFTNHHSIKPKFWFIPYNDKSNKFYIVKNLKGN